MLSIFTAGRKHRETAEVFLRKSNAHFQYFYARKQFNGKPTKKVKTLLNMQTEMTFTLNVVIAEQKYNPEST